MHTIYHLSYISPSLSYSLSPSLHQVLDGDFFLVACRADFIENARLCIFETFCRIHQCISIRCHTCSVLLTSTSLLPFPPSHHLSSFLISILSFPYPSFLPPPSFPSLLAFLSLSFPLSLPPSVPPSPACWLLS